MTTVTTNSRNFMRNFRSFKEKLLNNDLSTVLIPENRLNCMIKITVIQKPKLMMSDACAMLRSNPVKDIKRADIFTFDNLFDDVLN